MNVGFAVQVMMKSHVVVVVVGSHANDQVYLVIEDQIYFVASNNPQVLSVVHEYITGCACRSIPLP